MLGRGEGEELGDWLMSGFLSRRKSCRDLRQTTDGRSHLQQHTHTAPLNRVTRAAANCYQTPDCAYFNVLATIELQQWHRFAPNQTHANNDIPRHNHSLINSYLQCRSCKGTVASFVCVAVGAKLRCPTARCRHRRHPPAREQVRCVT